VTVPHAPRILIADDQTDVLEALRLLLKPEGYAIRTASSPAGVLAALESGDFDVVLMDLNYARDTTSGAEGLDLLGRIREMDGTLPVVLMTAWGSIELAVEGMRRGARDFIQKPWDNARLLVTLATQVELSRALRQSRRLEEENRLLRESGRPAMIAQAPAMQPVLQMIARVGPSDASVLVTGESGAGKGLIAQALHAASARAAQPFVAVNTGGLSESLFESEFFGHVKGAFTDAKTDRAGRFELADGGTLFLDEIANVPLSQQAKLLRAIETGEFERVGSSRTRRADIRLISATNADLSADVAAGRFREDLLFRINTVEIRVPPLRQRREDIPSLAAHFLAQHSERYRKRISGFTPDAMRLLMTHAWPGNVRELDHAVERAVLMTTGAEIAADDLMLTSTRQGASPGRLEEMSLEEVEGYLIQKTLARFGGNVSRAAEALGLSRSALYRRLERHGL
jgi:DNA-binding NtrC family response regulator